MLNSCVHVQFSSHCAHATPVFLIFKYCNVSLPLPLSLAPRSTSTLLSLSPSPPSISPQVCFNPAFCSVMVGESLSIAVVLLPYSALSSKWHVRHGSRQWTSDVSV
ncbi:hypothetical protein KIPB_005245 [Kipferlia bialata]|uniref:Uncharacterized protein n=1 Tax=Kipferlia bialata TaxID=797122 RepID=A0A9K3CVR5_9EUKA|nr:hypothetical protein KIPB_005245 [Kipferlia bialata]|eukprot:g5245.t1